jgi:C4-dicarboxylate transporter, DctM subunit
VPAEAHAASERLSWPARLENAFLIFALAAIALVPAGEILLRRFFHTGIEGATSLTQHLTLVISLVGALVASRENRLLSLASSELFGDGKLGHILRLFSRAVAALVCLILAHGGYEFVLSERESGQILAYGVPLWWLQALLPVGFLLIAARLWLSSGPNWSWRAGSTVLTLLMGGGLSMVEDPSPWKLPGLIALVACAALGVPIFAVLGGAALLLFWVDETPLSVMALNHYQLVINPTLPAIPLFTLAGYFLAGSKAPDRLIRLFTLLFGRLRGGAALVTVIAGTFFAAFTGASGVTILALGGLFLPLLLSARYSEKDALGLITGSGSLGALVAPALPLILYAVIAQQATEQIFFATMLPALLMVTLTLSWAIPRAPKPDTATLPAWEWKEILAAILDSKWELLLPVVAFTALFGGFATPVEAASITAIYAFLSQALIHRDLKLTEDVPRLMTDSGLLVGGILLILGMSLGLTNYMVDAQIPDLAVEWITGEIQSPWVFLLALNASLLAAGMLMDMYSAIVVLVPLILPIAKAYGIHPLHLGAIFLANLELGYMTPPVGMNLFYAAYRFGKPITSLFTATLPLFLLRAVGMLAITFIPALSTLLPKLLS